MSTLPLISAIVLNWNGKDVIGACLRSLRNQTYSNLEIILVDNASTDGSIEDVAPRFPDLHVVKNHTNLGYGGGNNEGIRAARGKYFFILNSDTEIEKDCIERLWGALEEGPRVGVTTPKILFYDQRERVDAAGLVVYPDGLAIGRGRSEPEQRYSQREEVFFGSGCASLYRKDMLDEIGLFDEDFFAYAEDTDLGWRAQRAGWKAFYVPQAVVYHHHSRQFGSYSTQKAFLVERNRMWVAWKNFPLGFLCLGPLYTLKRFLYQGIALLNRRGATGRFRQESSSLLLMPIVFKALFSGLRGFPGMLRKRREIQRTGRLSNRDFYRLLKKYGITAKEIGFMD